MNLLKAKNILLIFLGIFLAFISYQVLTYFDFFIHELGHANSAIIYTLIHKNPSIIINFSYINYTYFVVPNQTISAIPNIMSSYGVLASLLFYSILLLFISRIKIIKENKKLTISLIVSFILLTLREIIFNLFCGSDGFKLNCNSLFFDTLIYFFLGFFLISLGFFFITLINLLQNKK